MSSETSNVMQSVLHYDKRKPKSRILKAKLRANPRPKVKNLLCQSNGILHNHYNCILNARAPNTIRALANFTIWYRIGFQAWTTVPQHTATSKRRTIQIVIRYSSMDAYLVLNATFPEIKHQQNIIWDNLIGCLALILDYIDHFSKTQIISNVKKRLAKDCITSLQANTQLLCHKLISQSVPTHLEIRFENKYNRKILESPTQWWYKDIFCASMEIMSQHGKFQAPTLQADNLTRSVNSQTVKMVNLVALEKADTAVQYTCGLRHATYKLRTPGDRVIWPETVDFKQYQRLSSSQLQHEADPEI